MGREQRDWDRRADELARDALAEGEPAAWFDRLYREGVRGTVSMPWDREVPNAQLADWLDGPSGPHPAAGADRAVVVGCGLGADAEHLTRLGWRVTGFDLAPTAVEQARARQAASPVDYRVADLLDLPAELVGGFDLVVEVFTLQALPDPPRAAAAAGVASLLAPGGTAVVVAFRDAGSPAPSRPPFPLAAADLALLAVGGVDLVEAVEVEATGGYAPRWLATYRRDG